MEPLQLTVGGTLRHMIESVELGAVKQYNAAVQVATQVFSAGTFVDR